MLGYCSVFLVIVCYLVLFRRDWDIVDSNNHLRVKYFLWHHISGQMLGKTFIGLSRCYSSYRTALCLARKQICKLFSRPNLQEDSNWFNVKENDFDRFTLLGCVRNPSKFKIPVHFYIEVEGPTPEAEDHFV